MGTRSLVLARYTRAGLLSTTPIYLLSYSLSVRPSPVKLRQMAYLLVLQFLHLQAAEKFLLHGTVLRTE